MNIIPTTDWVTITKAPRVSYAPDDYIPVPPCYAFARGKKFLQLPVASDIQAVQEFNSKLITGHEILYSDPEVAHIAYIKSKRYADKVADASRDKGVKAGESEIAEKLSIQRRFPPYYYINETQLPEGEPTELFALCLDAYIAKVTQLNSSVRLMDALKIMLTDSDPFDTNMGFPTYSNEPMMRFMTAHSIGLKDRRVKTVIAQLAELAVTLGFPDDFLWPAAVARRSGALSKAQRYYTSGSDGLSCTSDSEVSGAYTRGRKVYMMPFYFNILVSPVAYALKKGRIAVPGFGHDAVSERSYLDWFKDDPDLVTAESDLSAYDMSIRPAYRKLLWQLCRKYGYDSDALDLLDEFENNVVILSGPWNAAQDGNAAVVRGKFGLLSGLKVTSEVGSALSAAATLKAMIECGVTTVSQVKSGIWPQFLMLGDDVLLRVKKGSIKPDIFERSYAEEGLKVKYVDGKRFLMNHVVDGNKFAVANRVIQQTAFNEDSYLHPGQVFLALASRLSKEVLPEHWPVLQEWATDMAKLVKLPEPFIYLSTGSRSSVVTRLLRHESVPRFLTSAQGQSWLADLAEKAKLIEVHAETLAFITSQGFTYPESSVDQRAQLIAALFKSDLASINGARKRVNEFLTMTL